VRLSGVRLSEMRLCEMRLCEMRLCEMLLCGMRNAACGEGPDADALHPVPEEGA
jgi:hypothetical protein